MSVEPVIRLEKQNYLSEQQMNTKSRILWRREAFMNGKIKGLQEGANHLLHSRTRRPDWTLPESA